MPIDVVEKIYAMARKTPRRIVLPEGEESRTLKAAAKMKEDALVKSAILLGDEGRIKANALKEKVDLSGVELVDPAKDPRRKQFADRYFELRKHKGISLADAEKLISDPLYFGTMMLDADMVDGFLSGATHATGDTIRPALQVIKPAPGGGSISSFFIMLVPNCAYGEQGVMFMADCAIVPDPSPLKLANIAVSTAKMARALLGIEPRVAMLSFSTKGSAEHELVDKVREATRLAKEKDPTLLIDGEMQADAALVPEIGKRKAPESPVAGQANVLIFPDLQSANIGYKLVERLAKATAIGPVLQGFKKPVNDLSRGCSAEDIVMMGAVTSLQADPSLR